MVIRKVLDGLDEVPHHSFGFQPRAVYSHSDKYPDILQVEFNPRSNQYVILDAKGFSVWKLDAISMDQESRPLTYAKYEHRCYSKFIFSQSHNVYFCIGKNQSLTVLNKGFEAVQKITAGFSAVVFLLLNPINYDLIIGGLEGTMIWEYKQTIAEIEIGAKPGSNFKLFLKKKLPGVGGPWVRMARLDPSGTTLFVCSELDLFAYDLNGNLLYCFKSAHQAEIGGCVFSDYAKVLITIGLDQEIKFWSLMSGEVQAVRAHSRNITSIMLHPDDETCFLTTSLDGSLIGWSLITYQKLFVRQIISSADGGILHADILPGTTQMFVNTRRQIHWFNLSQIAALWAITGSDVKQLNVIEHGLNYPQLFDNSDKKVGFKEEEKIGDKMPAKRGAVVAMSEDSSVRIFGPTAFDALLGGAVNGFYGKEFRWSHRSTLSTPPISPMISVLDMVYLRQFNMIYVLVNERYIWLFTTRTNPASYVSSWNLQSLQEKVKKRHKALLAKDGKERIELTEFQKERLQTATIGLTTLCGIGIETSVDCNCISGIYSQRIRYSSEELSTEKRYSSHNLGNFKVTDVDIFIALGMSDGRILFWDPLSPGLEHCELNASHFAISRLNFHRHGDANSLIVECILGRTPSTRFREISVWSFPNLARTRRFHLPMAANVYVLDNVAPAGATLFSGHTSGFIEWSEGRASDQEATFHQIMDRYRSVKEKAQHRAPVVAVDSNKGENSSIKIYLSASTRMATGIATR